MELSDAIRQLGNLLGAVVTEQESHALFETEEDIRALAKSSRAGDADAARELAARIAALSADSARAVASAFTVYFDLVNIAEEVQRAHVLRQRERELGLHSAPMDDSIEEAIFLCKERGIPAAQMQALLDRLHIELVITAHPTEAKRRTTLSKLARIAALVRARHAGEPLPRERAEMDAQLAVEITTLWLTRRARTTKPEVMDEVRTGLYYVENIFWDALPRCYDDLRRALAQYYPTVQPPRRWLSLASWIGGDRDGNPNVTTPVTAETLRLHRGLAIETHRETFHDLARRLSISAQRIALSDELQDWLRARHPLPPHVAYLEKRYADEPFRLALSLLAHDLEDASHQDMTARLLEDAPHKARVNVAELAHLLDLIAQNVPPRLRDEQLLTARRQMEIFGLSAARLDARQESARLIATLAEILRALDIDPDFERDDDTTRANLLVKLLAEPPAPLARHAGVTADTAETWSLFKLMARARNVYGKDLLGPFIISMTRAAADVLTVLLLARWANCADGLQIVPLFESLDDLTHAPRILADLFARDAYRAHLATCANEQMVMIGYSDSNKDAGYLAANWALYRAQAEIARVCAEYRVNLTLFHGRGGTIARGGGPTNRAIRAQPPHTVNGRFRLTEQGETLSANYPNPELAQRKLEQIVNAVLLASLQEDKESGKPVRAEWLTAMDAMARVAHSAYRALVYETPRFLDFWRAVTPIDEIARLTIGSRPVARRADNSFQHIRAIPWVFAWMQARFNLPGWYGLGAALESVETSLLQELYGEFTFFRALLDNAEMSLLKADMRIAALYVELATDRAPAQGIFDMIRREYDRTREMLLTTTRHSELMDADPVIQQSAKLRNPYVDPLNYIQVEMLRRLRMLKDPESAEAVDVREVIQITINGIAAGLRNTG